MAKYDSNKSTNILIVGYYGYSNSGDDAILSSICHDIKSIDEGIEISVLSNEPSITETEYGVKAYRRFNLIEIIKAIRACDVLLMGGGSLLQDVSSSKSLYYYLTIIRLAKCLGKRVMLYANGIGPISRPMNQKMTARMIQHVDMITLREALSKKTLDEMGVKTPPIYVTADPVFGFEGSSHIEGDDTYVDIGHGPYMTVMVRNWKCQEDYIPKMAKIFDLISSKYHIKTVFIPMKYPADVDISRKIQALMLTTSEIIDRKLTRDAIMYLIENATLVLSMRLHALIYSAIEGVPMIGFEYDPKIDYYMQVLDMPIAGHVTDIHIEEAVAVIEAVLEDLSGNRSHVRESAAMMKEKARDNVKMLETLL